MPYFAGFSSYRVSDPDGPVPCGLWYPTHTKAQQLTQGVYDMHVAKKGEIAQGRFPLIMISHGSGGTRFGHCKTAEMLAENGYMVLAPEHPKNNFFDDRGVGSAHTYQYRSRHMKSALDAFLGDPTWGACVDPQRIAVFGFSLGGYTALTCVGARPYVKGLRQHIRTNREFDPIFSGYEVIVRDGFDDDYLPTMADPRYKACIALAPVSGGLFPKASLQDITCPIQVFRAERDMILRNPFHAHDIQQNLPAGCDYHVTPKAGHFSYLSPVREDAKATLGELANDDPGFNRAGEHAKIHHLMLIFLDKALS
ncbi:alpha/beta fold hydrolase [Terasakiella sp. SH-1]|uniref:alpha/beta hydrolase family protein n=1 Tax=Terasakiella sp. SH-1 TaxID=2560057 RepID=UPI0010748668|nr:alpha/beta fold hydrolase [Terasakiella sp. SH-1]